MRPSIDDSENDCPIPSLSSPLEWWPFRWQHGRNRPASKRQVVLPGANAPRAEAVGMQGQMIVEPGDMSSEAHTAFIWLRCTRRQHDMDDGRSRCAVEVAVAVLSKPGSPWIV